MISRTMPVEKERKDGETNLGEHLRAVAGAIVADGRVDFDETTRLLEILKPLGEFDAKAVGLRKAVEEVREDGVVGAPCFAGGAARRLRRVAGRFERGQHPAGGAALRVRGAVMQNAQVMTNSIFRTIIGETPDLSLDDAWAAAEASAVADDIRAMPMQMQTILAEDGSVSGGQRQRIMIARALARKPRILILDEATSALDNASQRIVTETLAKLKDVTKIVIAHRLSTVRTADRIYVLDAGRVAEEGTFDELMAKGGLFATLAKRQM